MATNDLLRGHVDDLVLAILRDRAAHGYEIIERLRERSEDAFDLPEGTIYPALHRLERDGLLDSEWQQHGGRRRRVYRLSAGGAEVLRERSAAWRAFARGVDRVLGGAA